MKNRILEILQKTDEYMSGEKIGKTLGISRTAIWKGIKKLKDEGYVIEAVKNKGYKILKSGDILNETEISLGLKTKYIGRKMIVLDSVDSTNNYLRTLAFNNVPNGTTVITLKQEQGKGRRGKSWISARNEGLWMSILLKPEVEPKDASKITLITGLSVCQTLKELGFNASIKWPNDVIINNKKVCGILTEMNTQIERVDFVIVGVGININNESFPEELMDIAISLKMADGVGEKRSIVAYKVLNNFEKNYLLFEEKGFSSLKAKYEENCITLNKDVEVLSKNNFSGQAVRIDENGELVVKKMDGTEETVFSNEVSVRGVLGWKK